MQAVIDRTHSTIEALASTFSPTLIGNPVEPRDSQPHGSVERRGRSKRYVIREEVFERQRDLEDRIKHELAHVVNDRPFYHQLLADIINSFHDEVISEGQRSTGQFIYLSSEAIRSNFPEMTERIRGGRMMFGMFSPCGLWRDVTVYPWRKSKNWNEIKRALREKANKLAIPHPTPFDVCDAKGCTADYYQLEYSHDDPKFDEMAEACKPLISPSEMATRFEYRKFAPNTFTVADFIPDDHPAVQEIVAMHERNWWRWLCPLHHRGVGR